MAGKPGRRERTGRAPAHGASGSWPPFEPGNEASVRHGAYSPRKIEPLAEVLVVGLLALAHDTTRRLGYLAEPQYRVSLWAWARTEARVQLVAEWLLERGSE